MAARMDIGKMARTPPVKSSVFAKSNQEPSTTEKIVVIATSSGGPRALSRIIPALPRDLLASVLVVQHIPSAFIPALAQRLNWESAIEVHVADGSVPILQGRVLVMPTGGSYSFKWADDESSVTLTVVPGPDVKPYLSADDVMTSVAKIFGRNTVGVVLTGMGNDGTKGLQAIKARGGRTIAEHESTCLIDGMPRSAISAGVVDTVVPLDSMAMEITDLVAGMSKVQSGK